MLRLNRLEITGFGPFAESEVIEFPEGAGVTVIYGENMRGKTSLLNAIRFAFFGLVLGRGSRPRRLHAITNRERAIENQYGFSVALQFTYEGIPHELVREVRPAILSPTQDSDYEIDVHLMRGNQVLGPQERDHALTKVFPSEVSRFFLFDGELLQEYEELLFNESEAGQKISEAIERILGVPILKRARSHLTKLSEDADNLAAKEASKNKATEGLGSALQAATDQRAAHQAELKRKQDEQKELLALRSEAEQQMQAVQKYARLLEDRDEATNRLEEARADEEKSVEVLQATMRDAWRALLVSSVSRARKLAQARVEVEVSGFMGALRRKAVETGACDTCGQPIGEEVGARLRSELPESTSAAGPEQMATALDRLASLNSFEVLDNSDSVRTVSEKLTSLRIEQANLKDRIKELTASLSEADPEAVRRTKFTYQDVVERLGIVKTAIAAEAAKVTEKDDNIQRLKRRIEAAGSPNLQAVQRRAKLLRDAAEVFAASVERYKADLRTKVEATSSELFRAMTTEVEDYTGLTINEGYGLTIRHRDGRAEEARSAGAEHVVALALMGALQSNAPLKGPIVMDSPFGRLDDQHTANVVRTLPKMAEQIVLLVYEAEVGRAKIRQLLGSRLLREYQLERQSSRRTKIREVK